MQEVPTVKAWGELDKAILPAGHSGFPPCRRHPRANSFRFGIGTSEGRGGGRCHQPRFQVADASCDPQSKRAEGPPASRTVGARRWRGSTAPLFDGRDALAAGADCASSDFNSLVLGSTASDFSCEGGRLHGFDGSFSDCSGSTTRHQQPMGARSVLRRRFQAGPARGHRLATAVGQVDPEPHLAVRDEPPPEDGQFHAIEGMPPGHQASVCTARRSRIQLQRSLPEQEATTRCDSSGANQNLSALTRTLSRIKGAVCRSLQQRVRIAHFVAELPKMVPELRSAGQRECGT